MSKCSTCCQDGGVSVTDCASCTGNETACDMHKASSSCSECSAALCDVHKASCSAAGCTASSLCASHAKCCVACSQTFCASPNEEDGEHLKKCDNASCPGGAASAAAFCKSCRAEIDGKYVCMQNCEGKLLA